MTTDVMTTEGLSVSTLERLSHLARGGHPVLSVYLDLDPTRFPTPSARDSQLGALLGEGRRRSAAQDADRIQAMLEADPAITRGVRALAIFSCAEADILEAVGLPSPVEPMAVVDTVLWLEPLAAMISPGDWGVAVVSRASARLFRGGPGALSEFATVRDEVHRRHAQGGWSQANFQRGIEEQVAVHVRKAARRLLRAHQYRPFGHLVIIASGELEPVVRRSLDTELAGVLAGIVNLDLEHASGTEILAVVAPVIDRAQCDQERALIARVEEGIGTGGPAAAGLDEVLSMLEQDRVQTLLVLERSNLVAGRCPQCGRLSSADDGRCRLDAVALAEVDAVEQSVEEAAQRSARVVIVRHETDWLHAHGDIAALLRW
jgi:peptide chain release factor subunit 1